ncbi:MAG: TIGR00341 family protein [Bacteroidales bacterium]|nr:TIGR00341 family protein [Bacteroidales bacterium]
MKITGFIPHPEIAATVVAWTFSLADADDEIEFLCYEKRFSEQTQLATKELLKGSDKEILVKGIYDPMVVKAVVEESRKNKSELLVTSQFSFQEVDGVAQNAEALVQDALCKTFLAWSGGKKPDEIKRILFITTGHVHDRTTLSLLNGFSEKNNSKITIASVEDETGAKAGKASEQDIKSLLHDVGLDEENFELKVVVNRIRFRGIKKCYEDHDMIVAGHDSIKHLLLLEQTLNEATFAIVKRNPPLRLKSLVEWLPRINPSDHADLIHDLRQGSRWGPDFVVMLGLAAAVSTLGLMQDSPAVVIGSMLLAPLMTPMMGLGLALAQANIKLMFLSLKSILLGFLLTLVISFILGLITPSGETLPQEVLARSTPNVLDLMIALFAAGAAAFAMARPNIVGAIAGVAIATALVPPACSIGISLAHGAFLNAFGAALLFFANLIAIIAASSFTFSFLGIISNRAQLRHRRVATLAKIGLVAVMLLLFGPMSKSLMSTIAEGKNVTASYPVTTAVARAVQDRVHQDEDVEVILMARSRSEHGVIIHIASKNDLPKSYAREIKQIVRQEMNDPDIPVQVVAVRSIWIDDMDDDEETGN